MRRVGIEVLLRQAHLRQVFAGGAAGEDRVRRRKMVRGDVVAEHRQRAHAAQRAFAGQRAFPVRRAADVGAHPAPVVQRVGTAAVLDAHVEHRRVHLAELFGLDAGLHHRVDLGVARPRSFSRTSLPSASMAEHVLLDVEAHRAGDGVGDHQRRRGEEGLLRVGMDAAVEIAVAAQDRHRVAYRSRSMISCWIAGSSAPLMPLQVVQANRRCRSRAFQFRQQLRFLEVQRTAFDPGASEDFTHGLRARPFAFALRASSAAAITLRGLRCWCSW